VLRLFALVMLLANAGYFAWSQGHLRALGWGPVEQREPERVAQQLGADKLRLEGATPTPATPSPTPTTTASTATEPAACHAVAGLSPAQATAVTAALGGAGLDNKQWALDEAVLPERWIVYVGKFPSTDLLNRKKTELRSLRVEFRDVNAPALQPGLALGTYSTEAAAQTALQDLGRSGVRSAKVTKEREEQRSVTVRLLALTEAERARIDPVVQQAAGKPLATCP